MSDYDEEFFGDFEEGYAPPRSTRGSDWASPSDVLPTVLEVRYGSIA